MSQSQAGELRRQAEMMLQAAAVPTTGSHCTNKMLVQLAERLQQQAAVIEAQASDPHDPA